MTLAIRLEPTLEKRLEKLAKETKRTKSYYVREALLRTLEDIEDYYTALYRLEHPPKRYLTMEEVERKHGLGGSMGSKSRKKPRQARRRGKK
jgi:RHH-type transcriptional regulator, rel operon repressor / antitoxin RelB